MSAMDSREMLSPSTKLSGRTTTSAAGAKKALPAFPADLGLVEVWDATRSSRITPAMPSPGFSKDGFERVESIESKLTKLGFPLKTARTILPIGFDDPPTSAVISPPSEQVSDEVPAGANTFGARIDPSEATKPLGEDTKTAERVYKTLNPRVQRR